MRSRTRAGTGVLVLVALVSACVPRVQQPDVWLAGARLGSIGLTGGVVNVHLNIYNPNRFALRAGGLTYDLDLEDPDADPDADGWVDFTEGRLDQRLDVAAGDTAVVVVPVEFSYRGAGQALRGLLERGSFDYRVSGIIALEGPVRRDIRYRHAGAVTPGGVR